jgi:hypothetical protein
MIVKYLLIQMYSYIECETYHIIVCWFCLVEHKKIELNS